MTTAPGPYFHGTTADIPTGDALRSHPDLYEGKFVYATANEEEARRFGARYLRYGSGRPDDLVHVYEVALDPNTLEPDYDGRGASVRAATGTVVRRVSTHRWEDIREEVEG